MIYSRKKLADDSISALSAIKRGDLTLLKGDIGYGLLGNHERAIRKMYEAKGRTLKNPCIVIGNLDVLEDVAICDDPDIKEWIVKTATVSTIAVVLPVNKFSKLLKTLDAWTYGQTVTNESIAIFLNVGEFMEMLVSKAYDECVLIVGSSANPSSQGNIYAFDELPEQIVNSADFALNHGRSKHENPERKATTIVNFTNWSVKRIGVNGDWIVPSFNKLRDHKNRELTA